jgi:hypothetical protein
MKRYLIGLTLSGAAARIRRLTRKSIPSRRPTTVGSIGMLLVGACIGATASWVLAQKRRVS